MSSADGNDPNMNKPDSKRKKRNNSEDERQLVFPMQLDEENNETEPTNQAKSESNENGSTEEDDNDSKDSSETSEKSPAPIENPDSVPRDLPTNFIPNSFNVQRMGQLMAEAFDQVGSADSVPTTSSSSSEQTPGMKRKKPNDAEMGSSDSSIEAIESDSENNPTTAATEALGDIKIAESGPIIHYATGVKAKLTGAIPKEENNSRSRSENSGSGPSSERRQDLLSVPRSPLKAPQLASPLKAPQLASPLKAPQPSPAKAAPQPSPAKAAPQPSPAKAAPQPSPAKAAPQPSPAKAAPQPSPAKAAPQPSPVKAAPQTTTSPPKAPQTGSQAEAEPSGRELIAGVDYSTPGPGLNRKMPPDQSSSQFTGVVEQLGNEMIEHKIVRNTSELSLANYQNQQEQDQAQNTTNRTRHRAGKKNYFTDRLYLVPQNLNPNPIQEESSPIDINAKPNLARLQGKRGKGAEDDEPIILPDEKPKGEDKKDSDSDSDSDEFVGGKMDP